MSYECEADFTCKIIVIGNYQAGKTSLVEKYVNDNFNANQRTTIGVDFRVKYLEYDNKLIKSYIWDTAGQERFMTIVSSYYRTINGAVLEFDLNDADSFIALNAWMRELENNKSSTDVNVILVGNKCDIEKDEVTDEDILEFMKESVYPISYIKTSAKTGHNVSKVFETLVQNMYDFNKLNKKQEKEIGTLQLEQQNNEVVNQYNYWKYLNWCW
jgi:Ras-related protein Rab-1A